MPLSNIPGLTLDRAHPLSRGLVMWLPMNEGAGERVNDISGNGNHGAFAGITQGETSGWTGGAHGRAVRFDASDDRIVVPDSESLSITGAITLCAWVNITSFADYGTIIGKGTSYPNPYAFAYYPDKRIILTRGNGASQGYLESTATLVGGKPEFVCASWGGGSIKLYFDGVLRDSNSGSNPTVTDDGQSLYLGRRRDNVVPFGGSMWHLRIYNRALANSEIAQLYADPMAGAYWDDAKGLPVIEGILSSALAGMILAGSAVAPVFAALSKTLVGTTLLGISRIRNKDRSVYSRGSGAGGRRATPVDLKGNRTVR